MGKYVLFPKSTCYHAFNKSWFLFVHCSSNMLFQNWWRLFKGRREKVKFVHGPRNAVRDHRNLLKYNWVLCVMFKKSPKSIISPVCFQLATWVMAISAAHQVPLLKVDSNEKWGGSERWPWLCFSLGLWRSMAICPLNMQFLFKIHISVSSCYSQINRRRPKRYKMLLLAITPPIGNARWTAPENPQILSCLNIHPANLIRLAYSRNKLWFRQYQWLCRCSHLE